MENGAVIQPAELADYFPNKLIYLSATAMSDSCDSLKCNVIFEEMSYAGKSD